MVAGDKDRAGEGERKGGEEREKRERVVMVAAFPMLFFFLSLSFSAALCYWCKQRGGDDPA